MDALSLVKKHADYDVLLNEFDFKSIDSGNKEIRCACGLHGGNNPSAFVVNKDNGLWFCHTGGCGGGDIVTLVEKKLGLTFTESVEWLSNRFNIDLQGVDLIERTELQQSELKAFTKAIRARKGKNVNVIQLPEGKKLSSFRDFKKETLQLFSLSYHDKVIVQNKENKDVELRNRIMFPIISNDVCIGYGLRRTVSTHQPKWFYQPLNLVLGNHLYNYDNVRNSDELYVVEGMTDVMAFTDIGIPAVATFGAHMTEEQERILLRSGATLVIAYDGDDAGIRAKDKVLKRLNNKANLYYIDFKPGEDPANISREELMNYVRSKKRHY